MRSVDLMTAALLLASVTTCHGAAGFFDGFGYGGGKGKGKGESPKHVYYVVHNPIYVQQKPKGYGHGGGYGGHGGGYGHGGGHGGGYGGGHFITYETAGGYGHKGYGHDIGYHRSDHSGEYDQLVDTGLDHLDRSGYKQGGPGHPQEKTGYHHDGIVKSHAEYEYIGGHSGAFHVMDYGDKKDQKHG